MQSIFKRFEQKYILTKEQFININDMLDKYFNKDKYFKSNIYNIYFDNDNNDMIINSIEKPIYKQKVRLRSYKEAEEKDTVFLEVKKKYKGIVYKRRVNITLKEFGNYFHRKQFPKCDQQIIKEIDYVINYFNLHPSIFVAYDRLSYYAKDDKNFRITFDTNLRSRFNNFSLNDTNENKAFFDDEVYIMEVKSLYNLPIWFITILNENKIYPRSFSKVGNIYKKEKGVILC